MRVYRYVYIYTYIHIITYVCTRFGQVAVFAKAKSPGTAAVT